MGRVDPRVTVPTLDPLSPHHSPMPGTKTCRVSAGHTKESHTEAKRDAVWIVKKKLCPNNRETHRPLVQFTGCSALI